MESPCETELQQNIFKETHPTIHVIHCHESSLNNDILASVLTTATDGVIGVAPAYGSKCALGALALASSSQVLLVRLPKRRRRRPSDGRKLLQNLFRRSDLIKLAFKMDRVAAALYLDLNLRISGGVDLLSVSKADRLSLQAIMDCLGGETTLHKKNVQKLFKQEEKICAPPYDTALQAWAACRAGTLSSIVSRLAEVPKITTANVNARRLHILSKTLRDADRLAALKPTRTNNEINPTFSYKQGKLELTSVRFKTRVTRSRNHQQTIEITATSKGKDSRIPGRVKKVKGRAATISLNGGFYDSAIRSVTTIGREDLTGAEKLKAKIMLRAFQQRTTILDQPFVQGIWISSAVHLWFDCPLPSPLPIALHYPSPRDLNLSQRKAVEAILSNHDNRIQLIHGPPGTGKTTVIAASVTSVMASADHERTLWLVAQSNVAVKNIAEKLVSTGFDDFKLIVSKEFHFDWHEHLYHKIDKNLIRSNDLSDDLGATATERLLSGSKVILCTLSMLSNEKLAAVTRTVPVQTVIFDEASQIEIGDYFPMLYRFAKTLRKLVFIGDNLQLPPFGQDSIDDLQSIFEMPHLRDRAIFLDTQYRMPVPIGSFISQKMYNDRLKSVHAISEKSSCYFVDVHDGKEVQRNRSWVNFKEIEVVIALSRRYHGQGKSYRIITPYDAQRSELEAALKQEKLPWEDKCFNVDAFQGNEEDHIIISLVRSDKIGFLRETRRVNVMLTRCKRSMIICTSRAFIEDVASSSLVGALATTLGAEAWAKVCQVLEGIV